MKLHKDNFDIIFFGRGGQGAKVISEIIAQAAVKEGKFVQAFPYFGPERSGAPTKAFVRISDKEIRIHEPIVDPDAVVVLDETLLNSQDITKNLDVDESLIVNSTKRADEVSKLVKDFKGKTHAIDASGIALKIIGQPRPNSVILGKFVQVTEIVKLEDVVDEFKKIFEAKIGREMTAKNILAIEKGYDSI
jgi:2-oxoacid:acceptor oxidoreductase gamma subunit (pyruvate/2-ketoisovalerate family)